MDTLPSTTLPPPPARLFLAGLGGIGMSALAQLLRWQGHEVAGSDRELAGPGRDELYARLQAQGIRLFPQDGTGLREFQPAALIHSTAVEEGNPDFQAAAARAIPRRHRAAALAAALDRQPGRQIGIAGSCGKTSVTAWLAETIHALGHSVLMVGGGHSHAWADAHFPGNFHADSATPEFLVYEVDESDGSLAAFRPHVGVVLNIGTDHFDRDRLRDLFAAYLGRCREAAVLSPELAAELPLPAGQPLFRFGEGLADYQAGLEGISFRLPGLGAFAVPQYGRHSASNAAAVLAILQACGLRNAAGRWPAALAAFRGVSRRFDRLGTTPAGAALFDDYAHNVEKLCAALATAQELTPGPVLALFQPHGFGPLKFMREPLAPALQRQLRPGDRFAFLPVYYAGGTTDFTPSSAEVAAELRQRGLEVLSFPDRAAAASFVRTARDFTAVLVLGARDPGLPAWCATLRAGR